MQQTMTNKRTLARADRYSLPGFCTFWEMYPNKVGKLDCWNYWVRHGLEEKSGRIVLGVAAWKRSRQWQDPQYIMYPATFVRGEHYEDSPQPGFTIDTLQDAVQAFKDDRWTVCNGIDCSGQRVGWNTVGLYLNKTRMILRANELKKAVFE